MHHTNMVCDVVAGLQEVLQQEPGPVGAPISIQEPQVAHVETKFHDNQQQLSDHMQHMQAMMQEIQLQYAAAPHPTYQAYRG